MIVTVGEEQQDKPVWEDVGKLFEQAKRLISKHGLSAKQMDEMIEREIS